MSDAQKIAELERRLEKLEKDTVEPMQASLMRLRANFTPSGYLDPQRLPQLRGEVEHLAGTQSVTLMIGDGSSVQNIRVYDESNNLIGTVPAIRLIGAILTENFGLNAVDVEVQMDRWTYPAPATGGNGKVGFNLNPTGTTYTVLSKTETGKLIDIGATCMASHSGGTNWQLKLRITIDGGTAQDIPLIGSGNSLETDVRPYVDGNFVTLNDDLVLPFGLEYKTSILVEAVVSGSAPAAGAYTFVARRGVLV